MMNADTLEMNFKKTLNEAAAAGLTAEQIRADRRLYNKLAEEAYEYLSKVVLRGSRNRSCIRSTDIPFEEFADDALMYFMEHLDAILACGEDGRIPYIVWKVSRIVIDKLRTWSRSCGVRRKGPDGAPERSESVQLLDDVGWSLIPDGTDLEQSFDDREETKQVLRSLAESGRAADAVSLIATAALGWKPAQLADRIVQKGFACAAAEVLGAAAGTFGLSASEFSALAESSRTVSFAPDADAKKLAADISRRSYTARARLRAGIGALR